LFRCRCLRRLFGGAVASVCFVSRAGCCECAAFWLAARWCVAWRLVAASALLLFEEVRSQRFVSLALFAPFVWWCVREHAFCFACWLLRAPPFGWRRCGALRVVWLQQAHLLRVLKRCVCRSVVWCFGLCFLEFLLGTGRYRFGQQRVYEGCRLVDSGRERGGGGGMQWCE
jgi:hypothetical protein